MCSVALHLADMRMSVCLAVCRLGSFLFPSSPPFHLEELTDPTGMVCSNPERESAKVSLPLASLYP